MPENDMYAAQKLGALLAAPKRQAEEEELVENAGNGTASKVLPRERIPSIRKHARSNMASGMRAFGRGGRT